MSQPPDSLIYTHFNILTETGDSYTINVPYFCQGCGNCCRNTSFPDPEHFESLIHSSAEIMEFLQNLNQKISSFLDSNLLTDLKRRKPCIFLTNNSCSIYPKRPSYCRNWFPRLEADCGAFNLHLGMSKALLYDHNYQIGTREVIYIGQKNPHSSSPFYPHVKCLEKLSRDSLIGYQFPKRSEAAKYWNIFLSFKPSRLGKQIFLVLNPGIKIGIE